MKFILATIFSLLLFSVSFASPSDGKDLEFSTILKQPNSGVKEEYKFVAQSSAEFMKALKAHDPANYKTSSLPRSIDYSKLQVIGIFCGEKSSTAYGIGVKAVKEFNDKVVIYYSVSEPAKDSTATFSAQLVEPFEIITIPKTRKKIFFEKTIVYL